ncbi:anthranilate/para-aminobenzoate synthase component I (plasmid) [Cylindrospermum stagnale PCC 7417]|uniref:Anthranilate/para-aminobenzoate synthase component I n=1 Tax=Cylindrospermum stagnale PCC 7417 TaxID=56107 RepID=K9X7W7_9NOST|nr:chorismate-binding protein [Cylindrospermum stagnale]AFZ28204.1 anthranilate/para-aminobenzoate synthase component I [Cylindrospermum stagnale PCC 7417]
MWIWHTETKYIRCISPLLSIEVVNIDGKLKVITCGTFKESICSNAPTTLSQLLVALDKWLEAQSLTASGIIGYECKSLLNEKLDWVTDSNLIDQQIQGESVVFVMQAGNTEEICAKNSISSIDSILTKDEKNNSLINNQTVVEVNKVVTHGLELRQKLDIDHLVVSVRFPVYINPDLLNDLVNGVKTPIHQKFLIKSDNWNLISCTPEQFISIADSKLQVQILAGTYQQGKDFDKTSLINEHLSARNTLRSLVEDVVGKLELIVDCDLLAFDKITHFHSAYEKPYHSDISMLSTLAHLTPSPATGTQDKHTQFAIQQIESRPRGYYGGCFFLRTPGCLESLVSIRSIFKMENSETGEMIVGAGLKKSSSLSSETVEIISKATSTAKLLSVQLGNLQ